MEFAVNTDDLQCDYDIDWRMPTYKGDDVVDVYDTERGVAKLEASSLHDDCIKCERYAFMIL